MKWATTFCDGTTHRDVRPSEVRPFSDKDRSMGGGQCTQGGRTMIRITESDIHQPSTLRSKPCPSTHPSMPTRSPHTRRDTSQPGANVMPRSRLSSSHLG